MRRAMARERVTPAGGAAGGDDRRMQTYRAFRQALRRSLAGVPREGEAGRASAHLLDMLESEGPVAPVADAPNPLGDIPDAVLAPFTGRDDVTAMLARLAVGLAGSLYWFQRPEPDLPAFMAGHANAEIIGSRGIEQRRDIVVGLTLMLPHVTYPDHSHPPEEVYIVLGKGEWRQEDEPWFTPGSGGHVYNPPGIRHAMRSGGSPLFALWCLNVRDS